MDEPLASLDEASRQATMPYLEAGAGWPAWSPDGTRIAFQTTRDGNSEIYLIAAAGGEPVNCTRSPGSNEVLPAWLLR